MIGELSKKTGVGIETIRYYEREGLLSPSRRRSSGYREYQDDAVRRLTFVRRAKELGFSLKETRELLVVSASKDATCKDIKHRTQLKIQTIDMKIADLQRIRDSLNRLAIACDGDGPTADCPILEDFYSDGGG